MSFEFLSVDGAERDGRFEPVARSAMERQAVAAGASFELRDGWNVAVSYERDADVLSQTAAWADVSHLRKLELQGESEDLRAIFSEFTGSEPKLGRAERSDDAWWCPLTAARVLVIGDPATPDSLRARLDGSAAGVVDVTTVFAGLVIAGPLSREVFARFCALDLRPASMPVGAVRPGSVARQPGIVLREADQRFLVLFGWAVAEYMWSQVAEAAGHLGGEPVGLDALAPLEERPEGVLRGA